MQFLTLLLSLALCILAYGQNLTAICDNSPTGSVFCGNNNKLIRCRDGHLDEIEYNCRGASGFKCVNETDPHSGLPSAGCYPERTVRGEARRQR
ncbi:hypothetical protein PG993_009171 [Apiospora rasikravindrae]|uniref:Uncharacterized protein n=1 Tax=Apiospora rasikravindrae TaxID=990691 RepID=A0ABR1SJY8_9PEZI